jgi:sigma-E factor negative regulatory protein RseC
MIETQARVLSTEQALVWEEPCPRSPCGRCDPVTGCRSPSIVGDFHPAEKPFHVHNPLDAQVGEGIVVSLPEPDVLKSGLLIYLAPLAGLCLGAALGAAVRKFLSVAAGVLGFCHHLAGGAAVGPVPADYHSQIHL